MISLIFNYVSLFLFMVSFFYLKQYEVEDLS